MKKAFLFSMPFALVAAHTVAGIAAESAPAITRTIVSDDAKDTATTLQELPPAKLTYDQLKKTYRPDVDATIASLRADAASNSGRVVEMVARVSGMMSTARGRTVILEQEGNISVFPMSLDMPGADLVSTGSNLRGLFLVTIENADVVLKPLAFSAAPATNKLPPSIAAAINTRANLSGGEVTPGDSGVVLAPQFGDVTMPAEAEAGSMARMTAPLRSSGERATTIAPAPIAPMTSTSSSSQSRVYDALARRFNPKLPAAQSAEIGAAIVSASRIHGLDPRFLSSIIAVESGFDPYSLSSSGAMGLGQIMPFNLRSLGITNAWSPTQNIHGAAKMLRRSLNEYRGRADATLLAVAAYNAGGGAVRRAGYRVPNGSQVQRYVWKVYNQYKAFAPELFASR